MKNEIPTFNQFLNEEAKMTIVSPGTNYESIEFKGRNGTELTFETVDKDKEVAITSASGAGHDEHWFISQPQIKKLIEFLNKQIK